MKNSEPSTLEIVCGTAAFFFLLVALLLIAI
jgi:hypothetical protein